jgi:hypothetical protein
MIMRDLRHIVRTALCSAALALAGGASAAPANPDVIHKTATYEATLTMPPTARAIPALKAEIARRFSVDEGVVRADAADEGREPDLRPFELDVVWRLTYESPRLISLSGLSTYDEGGDHTNSVYNGVVWDKAAARTVPLIELIRPDKRATALTAIAGHARASFRRKYLSEEDADDSDPSEDIIAAAPGELGRYALTYAAGETKANGIVLLWGAGEDWPHVIGEVRLAVPVSVFRAYLAPQWAGEFK